MIILWHLHDQTMRFGELAKSIDGITQKMLTQQLREMETDGLIERIVYPVVPPKVEYKITSYGKTLEPVLKLLDEWGVKHLVQTQAGGARARTSPVQG